MSTLELPGLSLPGVQAQIDPVTGDPRCFVCGKAFAAPGDGHPADCGSPCVPGHNTVTCVHCKANVLGRRVEWLQARLKVYADVVLRAQEYADIADENLDDRAEAYLTLVGALDELRRVNAEENDR